MGEVRDGSCERMRDHLALAAGQDLSDAAARRVWNHLAACMSCRREYSSYLELRSALAKLDPSGRSDAWDLESEFFV